MTPYEVASRMVRARRPDGTPIDAGLVVAYLEHEAALAGMAPERLLPPLRAYEIASLDVAALTAARAFGKAVLDVGRAFDAALVLLRRALEDGPDQGDFALAE